MTRFGGTPVRSIRGKICCLSASLAFLLGSMFAAHAIVTGACVPYPDPTPEQVVYAKVQVPIGEALLLGSAGAFATTLVPGVVWGMNLMVRHFGAGRFSQSSAA